MEQRAHEVLDVEAVARRGRVAARLAAAEQPLDLGRLRSVTERAGSLVAGMLAAARADVDAALVQPGDRVVEHPLLEDLVLPETQLAITQRLIFLPVGWPQRHGPGWWPTLIARCEVANPSSSSPAQMTSSA